MHSRHFFGNADEKSSTPPFDFNVFSINFGSECCILMLYNKYVNKATSSKSTTFQTSFHS